MNAYLHGTEILGSELLGADGLQNQYVLLRVRNIDKAVLQRKLQQPPGQPPSPSMRALKANFAGTTLSVIDRIPKAALDLVVPFVVKMLRDDYGITAEVTVSEVPLSMQARKRSEFFPGVVIGAAVGALLAWGGKQLFFSK